MDTRILHRQPQAAYPTISHGQGIYLFDTSGKRYLDGSGGAAVSCLGHCHPKVTEAIKRQLDQISFAHTGFFTNAPAEELAAWLTARAPEGFGQTVFVSGGSEAMEAALKFARQVHIERGEPARCHVIARRQSYHGTTLGTLAVGHHALRRGAFEPMLGAVMSHIAPCYAYRHRRDGETLEAYAKRAASELETEILRIGPDKVAAFVAETVGGATAGAIPPAPGYFEEIRAICDKYGVLLILDEVMCGMGRTGTLFACEQDNVVPDMIAVAKGLGGGYQPIGALLVAQELADTITGGSGAFQHGHTYMAHASACAGALAVQQVIVEEGLLENVRERGTQLMALLTERFAERAQVGDVRGRGLFVGVELVRDRASKEPFGREDGIAGRVKAATFRNGLICYPAGGTADGIQGDHILLAPPFIIDEDALEQLVDILDRSLAETFEGVTHTARAAAHG